MREIRKSLEINVDVMPLVMRGYDSGVLRQYRLGKQVGVNLTTYLAVGYDADQLEQIRKALEELSTNTSGIISNLYVQASKDAKAQEGEAKTADEDEIIIDDKKDKDDKDNK